MKSILIYDQSSAISKRFLEQTNSIGLPINKKKIYERIKNSPYQIKSVPCVLLFYPDGKIEKHEGVEGIKFMEVISNMEDEKASTTAVAAVEEQENDPEIQLKGNERWNPPPLRPDDNRPDPEAGRKMVPLQDSSDGEPNTGMTISVNRKLVDQMKRDAGKQ